MLLYIGFIIVGILLFIFSVLRLRRKISDVKSGYKAKGHVVRLEKIDDNDGPLFMNLLLMRTAQLSIGRRLQVVIHRPGLLAQNKVLYTIRPTR